MNAERERSTLLLKNSIRKRFAPAVGGGGVVVGLRKAGNRGQRNSLTARSKKDGKKDITPKPNP